ncbi:Uncharacterised protein [Mycobacteroides abscessus subsp. abscessus]|nr:Uncharacterised protein [Mycobacteroides abscessus subsp. abscessus]SHV75462.1 Uncharacterised protein [Mycobacteroides abscessus subsp. abscessus]SHW35624.1 Uncharacterised protein [Mycobacteroides abscessus subsp. abscessus]SHW77284.1 Uncharacterised protein [Mycobacteroides abscessus subsp. abscessus]SHW95479.1 Uncharacterised protein [Mycobacteroides abscessus subsp. abscessus]
MQTPLLWDSPVFCGRSSTLKLLATRTEWCSRRAIDVFGAEPAPDNFRIGVTVTASKVEGSTVEFDIQVDNNKLP